MKIDMSSWLVFAPTAHQPFSLRIIWPPKSWSRIGSCALTHSTFGRGLIVWSRCLVGLSQELRQQPIIRIYAVRKQLRCRQLIQPCCCYHVCECLLDGPRHEIQRGNSQTCSYNKQAGDQLHVAVHAKLVWVLEAKWKRIRLTSGQQRWRETCCVAGLCGETRLGYVSLERRGRNVLRDWSLCKRCLADNTAWHMDEKLRSM